MIEGHWSWARSPAVYHRVFRSFQQTRAARNVSHRRGRNGGRCRYGDRWSLIHACGITVEAIEGRGGRRGPSPLGAADVGGHGCGGPVVIPAKTLASPSTAFGAIVFKIPPRQVARLRVFIVVLVRRGGGGGYPRLVDPWLLYIHSLAAVRPVDVTGRVQSRSANQPVVARTVSETIDIVRVHGGAMAVVAVVAPRPHR